MGTVTRVYWREGEVWVRVRSREGTCLSVPWRFSDLPKLPPVKTKRAPLLSAQALIDLVRYLERNPAPVRRRSTTRRSSR